MSDYSAKIVEIERVAKGIRRRVLEHSIANNGGYMSQACSSAELLSSLYAGILNFAPVRLNLPQGVAVVNVDFTDALERLAFEIRLVKTDVKVVK